MNPVATLRLRRSVAILALTWASFSFLLMLHAHLGSARSLGPPFITAGVAALQRVQAMSSEAQAAGVRLGDELLALDGRSLALRTPNPLELREGEANTYSLQRASGESYEVDLEPVARGTITLRFGRVLLLGLPLVAWIYLAIALIVWRFKPDRSESWALLVFCSVVAAEIFVTVPDISGMATVAPWMEIINGPLIGASAFHLFTTYPIEPAWVVRWTHTRLIPYLVALSLSAAILTSEYLGISSDWLVGAGVAWTAGITIFCIVALAVERRRLGKSAATDRADVMLMGGFVSFVPLISLFVAEYFFRMPFPWHLALLWFFVFPLAVGYGIVAKQLFEIRMLARSSVAYGAATIAITGLYALLITAVETVVSGFHINARSPWFSVGFLFFAILAFNPLRDRLQAVVDRVFDRDRATYRRAVREISEAMVSMLSIKEVVDRILIALTDTMGVDRAMVLLFDEDESNLQPRASRGDWEKDALAIQISADNPIVKQLWVRREEIARVDFDREEDPDIREACRDVFDTLEVDLLVPILFGVDLLGTIAVGRKLSGERHSPDDRQLLRTLSNQSSIAIENARAFDEIAALNETLEARVEQRTAELQETQAQLLQSEKMRSLGQLVAGVAHELNNPIGFVHANLQLLDEYVTKLVVAQEQGEDTTRQRDAIAKLLKRSREGTERVKKIVQDLRTFSRMDKAELQEADLNREIAGTVALMEPGFKDGMTIEQDFGELPRVRCYAGQLNQVFMNLLMNASEAMDGRGTVRIRTRATRRGVRLEFEDDGPGISPEIQSRLFEPFFTTKPVGQGTGLGLSLAHGIVERHGGRMLVSSVPDHGATFVIELPLEPAEID